MWLRDSLLYFWLSDGGCFDIFKNVKLVRVLYGELGKLVFLFEILDRV